MMNETELVLRAQSGDAWALNALLALSYPRLCRMAKRTLRHEADALDAVQEVMIKAADSLKHLDDPTAFRQWVKVILRNCCVDLIRSRKRQLCGCMSLDQDGAPCDQRPFSEDRVEEGIYLDQVMDELGESASEVVCLRHLLGLTVRETARQLAASDGAIKVRLHRARLKALKFTA